MSEKRVFQQLKRWKSDPVLDWLLATVDDQMIFPPGAADRETLREILALIYETALWDWADFFHGTDTEWEKAETIVEDAIDAMLTGGPTMSCAVEVIEKFKVLQSGPVTWHVQKAILTVAARNDLPATYPARDFLFYMLGRYSEARSFNTHFRDDLTGNSK